jgi:hypothetical protein
MSGPAARWSRDEKEIAYRDIMALSQTTLNSGKFLHITYLSDKYIPSSGGNYILTASYTIAASMLPSRAVFYGSCEAGSALGSGSFAMRCFSAKMA